MPGKSRPSFLKRQKEQARKAKATEKREARRARKDARGDEQSGVVPELMAEGEFGVDEAAVTETIEDAHSETS